MSKKKIGIIIAGAIIILAAGVIYLIRTGIVSINIRRTPYRDPFSGMSISRSDFGSKSAAELYDDAVEYNKKGDYGDAAAFLNVAMQKDNNKNNANVLRELAVSYYNIKNYGEAIAIYDKIIQGSPNNASAYNELGNVYRDKGDRNNAEANYKKAIEVDPGYILAYNNLAMMYIQDNDNDAAKKVIQDGLDRNQNNAELQSIMRSIQQ